MQTLTSVDALRRAVNKARKAGKTIGFVPTMGNLHDGHLQLLRRAKHLADCVVVSIFVNPLQFGVNEDLDAYPRTLAADKEKLFAEGANFLFAPGVDEMYPDGMQPQTLVSVPRITDSLCGAARPGHFTGVATVVTKLFNMVQPDVAVFGEKDFQQLMVIRKMASDLCMPIDIVGVATVRETDGLAMSSRNNFLSSKERLVAPKLHRILQDYREAIANGFDNYQHLEKHAYEDLVLTGFQPDYVSIRDAETLESITPDTEAIVILAAARLGRTRLIDNVTLNLNPSADWGMLASN
jgi:pantoate--beta-alanine ligase